MNSVTTLLARTLKYVLPALLILIPAGIAFRLIQAMQLENTGVSTEWTGIVLMLLAGMEAYLLLHYLWFRLIVKRNMNQKLKLVQLLLIFILGVLPGLLALYPAFIKS